MVNSRKARYSMVDRKDAAKPNTEPAVRASISFPSEVYQTLETIAKEKKVSLAWVVREAAEQYIADKWPLFGGRKD
jgi:predicted DNA-binding ribbon-helix-helix protein